MHEPWPPARCPVWCVAVHSADDHPDDRNHHSDAHSFGVTILRTQFSDDKLIRVSVGTQLEILAFQPEDQPEPWLHIGDDETPGVDISVESARRLARALEDLATAL